MCAILTAEIAHGQTTKNSAQKQRAHSCVMTCNDVMYQSRRRFYGSFFFPSSDTHRKSVVSREDDETQHQELRKGEAKNAALETGIILSKAISKALMQIYPTSDRKALSKGNHNEESTITSSSRKLSTSVCRGCTRLSECT